MTRDDLVRRLVDLQREIGSTANGAHCYGVWARRIGEMIAALAAPPAAPPADLVAIVRDLQEADAVLKHVASARAMRRWHEALNKVVAYALEADARRPRVPDTPQGWTPEYIAGAEDIKALSPDSTWDRKDREWLRLTRRGFRKAT